MASLLGVDVDRVISLTFVMGAALAAVAGLMVTLYYGVVDFFIGFLAGVKAFTAAVLGGIGSLPGAMLGGLLIGLIEAFWSGYFSVEYKDVSVFVDPRPGAGVSCRPGCSAGPKWKRSDGGCPGPPLDRRSRRPRSARIAARSRTPLLAALVARPAGAAVCRPRKPTISAAARSACAPISTGSRSPSRRCSPAGSRSSCSAQRRARRAGQRRGRWRGSPPGAAATPCRSRWSASPSRSRCRFCRFRRAI